jgi:hypothetical protein
MATNTFKLKTKTTIGTSLLAVYTVPASTTTVIIGLTVANILGSSVNASAQIVSTTVDVETNTSVYFIKDIPLPSGSAVEIMSGNKIVLQAGDIVKVQSNTASSLDATLSIMEIS